MIGPVLAVRQAIVSFLQADSVLSSLMGGVVRLYDEPPRALEPVYAVFGPVILRDVASDGGESHEQDCELVVWSSAGSARPGLIIADRIAALLHDADLTLTDHHLVLLRLTEMRVGRDDKSNLARIVLRFRVLTQML
jgi:hypothetical protein